MATQTESTMAQLARSPWIWGTALTAGFYVGLPHAPIGRELLIRYFCGHPLEYALAGLFFVSLAILATKWSRLGRERKALALELPSLEPAADAGTWSTRLDEWVSSQANTHRHTWFVERVGGIADWLMHRRSGDGLEEHARYLASVDSDRQHDSYALLQTITWAVPILGFLGTVMGITLAIANVTPDQLDTSLDAVTGGLAVAFDTTALALSLSVLMVFGYFFVRRSEQQVLSALDARVMKEIVCRVPASSTPANPLVEAETAAARELIERTQQLIDHQTGVWQESVDGLRERWVATIESQQQELTHSLSTGVEQNLGHHAQLLDQLRSEFLSAWQSLSEATTAQMAQAREQQLDHQRQLQETLAATWQQIRTELAEERDARMQETERWLSTFVERTADVGDRLQAATTASATQLAQLSEQTELLRQIVVQEEQLSRLQEKLTTNLESLRAAEQLEETLHSLTAAVHLLTARARPKAA